MLRIIFVCLLLSVASNAVSFGQQEVLNPNSKEALEALSKLVDAANKPTTLAHDGVTGTDDPDFEHLMGKWIVISVEHDGELTPAQIGQKKGDIISIVARDNQAHFG